MYNTFLRSRLLDFPLACTKKARLFRSGEIDGFALLLTLIPARAKRHKRNRTEPKASLSFEGTCQPEGHYSPHFISYTNHVNKVANVTPKGASKPESNIPSIKPIAPIYIEIAKGAYAKSTIKTDKEA